MADTREQGEPVAVDETHRLIAADKVAGTPVFNRGRERVGSIVTVMLDKYSGRVAYAVLGFGGIFGLGERHHPLPWRALTYSTELGGYLVDVTREQLEAAPSHAADEAEPWGTPGYARKVDAAYGLDAPLGGVP